MQAHSVELPASILYGADVEDPAQVIRSGLGPLPFVKDKDEKNEGEEEAEEAPARVSAPASNRPAVLPDGSYATQVQRC